MRLYIYLSRIKPLSKNYSAKFLFIAFTGIHIPLIGIILYLALSPDHSFSAVTVILATLLLTLGATGITLYLLNQLLQPIHLIRKTLIEFIQQKQAPMLPAGFNDEIGTLMQSIQYALHRLSSADKDKTDLISMISHDIRSPMSQIIQINQLIMESDSMEKVKQYAGFVKTAASTQLTLVDDILTMLKAEDIQFASKDFSSANLNAIINDVIDALELKSKNKSIQFAYDTCHSPVHIKAHPKLLTRALLNVLDNSIKFSHRDSTVNIDVNTNAQRVNLHIRDQGIGFEPEIGSLLFNKFTKYNRPGTAGEATEGLGLYLTKTIVEMHGGSIEARSQGKNTGAEFVVSFPAPVVW